MAIWRKTAALSVPLATIAMMFLSAGPSQAALCNAGFVYGIAVDGSKVCVPLTKEVVGVLGSTLAPAQTTPAPAPPAQPPSPQPAPPAQQAPPVLSAPAAPASPPAAYVNSDSGQVVSAGPAGSFMDSNTKAPVQQNVVVPATALIPDAAVVAVVKEHSAATPSPAAPSAAPTTQPTADTSASAPEQSGPVAAAPDVQAVMKSRGFDAAPVVFGSTLILMGLAAVFFAYRSIMKSRNPVHGRRRAAG